jgi:hypothetical protein
MQEQKALVQWLSCHPIVRDYFFKIHNEGKRSLAQGYQLRLLGLRKGANDLFICYPKGIYHGLFLEMKRKRKYTAYERLTPTWIAQEQFMQNVQDVGYSAHFCFGWEHGKEIVENYMKGEMND